MSDVTMDNLFEGLTGKQRLFLQAFLDAGAKTYLHATESAIAAGYNCIDRRAFRVMGCKASRRCRPQIQLWLDEVGLSEAALKTKLLQLLNTKKTKFTKLKGKFTGDIPKGVKVVAETKKMAWSGDGENAEPFDDGETLVAIDTDNREVQRKTLDMALKVKGLYAPEELHITGLEGLAKRMNAANKRAGNGDE